MIRVPPPASAILFVAGVAILFMSGAVGLQMVLGEGGLPAAEWLFLLLPAVLFVRAGGYDPVATFSLRRPPPVALAGGILLVAGATPVAWAIGWLQSFVLPIPPQVVESLEQLVTAGSPRRLLWLLFAVAVTPAVCEEVVFRGVLLSSTRTLATWRVLLLNGVVFGAFHLSLETPIRFLPTAWLGIVIAWGVLRSSSLWTGVLMHLLNNAVIVVLASAPSLSRAVTDPEAPPPPALMALAVLALGAGWWLLESTPRPPSLINQELDTDSHSEAS